MSTVKSQNPIKNDRTSFVSTRPEGTAKKPRKSLEKKDKSKKTTDTNVLHEAENDFNQQINELAQKHGLVDKPKKEEKADPKKLGFFERFLHDEWGVRTTFALGNEMAESFEQFFELVLPKPIAKALYRGLWSLAFIATGSRVGSNAQKAKEGDKVKAGTKMLVHDGISAIVFPTIVARAATKIQNFLYKPLPIPEMVKGLFRSIVSIYACKVTIHKLDPHAKKFSAWLLKHSNDRHKEINEAMGSGHGHGKKDKHDHNYATAA